MGLFDFLRRLFGSTAGVSSRPARKRRPKPKLNPLRNPPSRTRPNRTKVVPERPYRFAWHTWRGGYLDLTADGDEQRLASWDLPRFRTPEELADWLDLPVGKLAWVADRFAYRQRPESQRKAHYHYQWKRKRRGGWRLIEAPKRTLKAAQQRILREVLDRVPPHPDVHGFVPGRSVCSAAEPHVGRRVLVKFDLENFYATVTFPRVVAIFRGLGYCREAALWLARLTTSALPEDVRTPEGNPGTLGPYGCRHLPQGAPTSPALANLSARGLDVRLSGFARSFGARYTRYADDLTFSGSKRLIRALPVFLPLVGKIIRQERFHINRAKRKVVRDNQRQTVTGVVVNRRLNVSRQDYDRLKATLTNCVRQGPASQNRDGHADFAAHLRGRVAHVMQLNPRRGKRLLELCQRIRW